MNEHGKSDTSVVPAKRANKAGDPAAESVEGRGVTKGNADQAGTIRTQCRLAVCTGLERIRAVAERERETRFTALLHHVNYDLLKASFHDLNRGASPGVDGVTWGEYARDLEENLRDLKERVHRGTYRAKPSKRQWIPKASGGERPLGIAALEDKIVQQAVGTVLSQIYEPDFKGFSYGFRPKRSAHDALDALYVGITARRVNWVLDADIRGFFDAIDHEWLIRFLEHRVADRRILRLVRKWLRSGVSEDGEWSKTKVGTPQGAVISPLLANVYLHYAFDTWADHWRKSKARGDVIIVRYADDFVVGFQHKEEAQKFQRELQARLGKFGLSLHSEKTRLLEFGRYAKEGRKRSGRGKPETFDFLGFTHYCGTTRRGRYALKRKSTAKRLRQKLQDLKVGLRRRMHSPTPVQGAWLRSVVRGWFNYHAVPGNSPALRQFRDVVNRLWLETLRRRSQKGERLPWRRMRRLIDRWIPRPQITHPYPNQRLRVRPAVGAV